MCRWASNALLALSLLAASSSSSTSTTCVLSMCCCMRCPVLQDNRLSGALPVDGRNQQLISIRASNNLFNGSISEDIWRLPELTTIDASSNE